VGDGLRIAMPAPDKRDAAKNGHRAGNGMDDRPVDVRV